MKIENVGMPAKDGRSSDDWIDFIKTVGKLKVGQSFIMKEGLASNYRMALAIAPYWLGKRFSVRKGEDGHRVGCIGLVKK